MNYIETIFVGLGLTLTSIFTSCSTTSNDLLTIDISNLENNECIVDGNDIFSKIENIIIETNDSCLMNSPSILSFDDENIFLKGYDDIKKFDREGLFKCNIGKRGHGYGEYVNASSAYYCSARQLIFLGTFGDEVYKYDINGKYIGKFSVASSDERLMTSKWCETLGLYVCETRRYRSDGLDVYLSTWTMDGKKVASYPVYSDNLTTECNFTHTGSMRNTSEGMLFMLPFDNTVHLLSKEGVSEAFVIDRGKHTPRRDLVEDNGNSAKLERECYEIRNWNITPNYIYIGISCFRGYRDVIIRRTDNAIIHNKYYSYKEDDGTQHLRLKELSDKASFWPWIYKDGKVAGLVENEDKRLNPILIIATEKPNTITK